MIRYIVPLLAFMFTLNAHAQKERKYIRQGNDYYKQENYNNSRVAYKKALKRKPGSFKGNYNMGNALYKEGQYKKAAKNFNQIAESPKDEKAQAGVYHNLGNAFLKSAQKSLKNKKSPMQAMTPQSQSQSQSRKQDPMKVLKSSIEAYKEALRNNPNDEETRYNLAYAKQLLNQQQQKQKQQKKNKKKQNKKDKQQQKNKNQQKQNQQQADKKNQDQKQQKAKPRKISKEDARRLLKNMANQEKKVKKKVKRIKAQQQKKSSTEKEW